MIIQNLAPYNEMNARSRSVLGAGKWFRVIIISGLLSLVLLGSDSFAGGPGLDEVEDIEGFPQLEQTRTPVQREVEAEHIAITWLSNVVSWVEAAKQGEERKVSIVRLPNNRKGVRLHRGTGIAHKVEIPEAGSYRLWVSYRASSGRRSPFHLKLIGQNTFSHTYGALKLSSPWEQARERTGGMGSGNAYREGPLGAGEGVVWECADAELHRGETTIRLTADDRTDSPPIESLVITKSKEFKPSRSSMAEEKTFGRLYLRVRLRGVQEPVGVSGRMLYMKRFSGPGRYNGEFTGGLGHFSDPGNATLTPGKWSAWEEATFPLTTGGSWAIGRFYMSGGPDGTMDVQMAWYPNKGAVAKSISTVIRQGGAYVLLPVSSSGFGGNPRDGWTPPDMFRKSTVARFRPLEALQEQMDGYCERALEAVGGDIGPLQHLQFHAFVQGPPQVIEESVSRLRRMGLNRFSPGKREGDIWLSYSGIGFSEDRRKTIEAQARRWKRHRDEKDHQPRLVKLGDEISNYAGPGKINSSPEGLKLFHSYLSDELERLGKEAPFLGVNDVRELVCYAPRMAGSDDSESEPDLPRPEGITDPLLGDGESDDAMPELEDEEKASAPGEGQKSAPAPDGEKDIPDLGPAETERLRVMSRRFITWLTAWYYRGKTEAIRKAFPKADTFTNHDTGFMFGKHCNQFDPLWIMNVRYQGTTMAAAEDWAWPSKGGTASCGIQTVSFYGAIMDCAAREHGGPKGFQNIATSNHAARKIFSLVGEGVFFQDLYNYGPPYFRKGGTIDCWGHKHWVYKQVAQALAALKPAEKRIAEGTPDPTRVAMITNLSDDLRDGDVPGFLKDRLLVYLALRHAQMPVDLLLERDLRRQSQIDLNAYDAIYLTGMRLEREAFGVLKDWCEAGGTLMATGMAATQDEFGDSIPGSDAFFGAGRAVATINKKSWHPDNIPNLKPLGEAMFEKSEYAPATSVPVVGVRYAIRPEEDCRTLAHFEDGSPAASMREAGEGRVILYAFQPGMSYRFDTSRQGGKICGYRDERRDVIAMPVSRACGPPRLTSSSPLVETTTFSDAAGLAVLLNDFTWEDEREMRITVRTERPVKNVAATLGKVKKWQQENGRVRITCSAPDPVDVIILDYE
ncbi:MAG: hypothetical protein ACLFWL_17155 [Candidatus Brocadiia bacterium]